MHLLIAWLRALVLLGLLAVFVQALGTSVIRDRDFLALPRSQHLASPGVRVLLPARDRATPAPRHERLRIDVLVPTLLLSLDHPGNESFQLRLSPGETVQIRPDVLEGITITSTRWGELHWQSSQVRIQPAKPVPAPAEDLPAWKIDPGHVEAADGAAVFALGDRRYRGSLTVLWNRTKELLAINVLPIEAYVEGVVAVEMRSSWPIEALKAQAIASRSYAFATLLRARAGAQAWDVNDHQDQDYRGTGHGNHWVVAAVRDTAGVVMRTANGVPFAPLFCASSGGYTTGIDGVLPGATDAGGRAPLREIMEARADPHCLEAARALGYLTSHWTSTAVLKKREIQTRLIAWLGARRDRRQVGYVTDLRVARRDPRSQRVETVTIHHTAPGGAPIELSAHDFRMMIGPQLIRSTLWVGLPTPVDSADPRIKDIQIVCQGYGHGVGLSQISAWQMAQQGMTASEILAFFYRDVRLQPW